ncbi:MAG: hypothetical protein HC824_00815 [Synechococcales cyanobacterium RM1_1_8]|nr:hypothetical protein [Synechococcales cyanobacterium RM1_1_8]
MATIEEIRKLNDENTQRILRLRQRRIDHEQRQAERAAAHSAQQPGHPWINWAITQLTGLNQWLVKKGWA